MGGPCSRDRLLGRRLLLFRQDNGEIAVLDDRCAHRAAPLSMGTLDDDQVVCALPRLHVCGDRRVRAGAVPDATCPTAPGCAATRSGSGRRSSGSGPATPARSRSVEPPDLPALRESGWTMLGGSLRDGRQLHAAARQRAGPHALPVRPPAPHPPRLRRGPAAAARSRSPRRPSRTAAPSPPRRWPTGSTKPPGCRRQAVHPARDRHVRLARPARRRDGHHRSRSRSAGCSGGCSFAPSRRSMPAAR